MWGGAEACARDQMVVTWQEGSGGTVGPQPNPWPWLFLPVVEAKVAPTAHCWREMEGGQLPCWCSVAQLYTMLQVDFLTFALFMFGAANKRLLLKHRAGASCGAVNHISTVSCSWPTFHECELNDPKEKNHHSGCVLLSFCFSNRNKRAEGEPEVSS